jgi:glycosyltransferase involved in cell wall biosynthesis
MSMDNRRLKIAFLTAMDPRDKGLCSWTATMFYMGKMLEKYCGQVDYLGPIRTPEKRVGSLVGELIWRLFKKNYLFERSFFLARTHARVAAKRLASKSYDVIFSPLGTTEVAMLETDTPIVLVKDGTFALMHNYYDKFSNVLEYSVREATRLEEIANKKSSLLTFSSAWAAASAVRDHGADPNRVFVVPFGANFEEVPPVEVAQKRKKSDRCTLLFVGAEWWRKGGDVAFETLVRLLEMGIDAQLVVCGCIPPETAQHERVRVIPYLNKNDEQQAKELEKLFETADFFILPTRVDCVPTVIGEAGAYGLPVLTSDVGGISDAIVDGENGFMMPGSAGGVAYAEVIAKVYRDDLRYAEMVRASRAAFDAKLNWDAWGQAHQKLIFDMLGRKGSSGASAVLETATSQI